jgi:cold shock CspA family protein
MGRSQETFGKKEVRSRKEKKSSFNDMIAYVDEFGMITSTPPDPDKKTVIAAESIELKITKNKPANTSDFQRKGVVTFYNESKGFGFIRDLESNQRVFVHANNLLDPIKENNIVLFEMGKGPKGISAMKVKLFKE